MNYMTREAAEAAAAACQGRAVVKGVPLRVQWGRPKPLDSLDRDQRMENARAGRETEKAVMGGVKRKVGAVRETAEEDLEGLATVAPPPGQGEVEYASLGGE